MLRDENLNLIEDCFKKELEAGYKEGVADGVRVAERILAWFLVNPQLKEPKSFETLEQWSRKTIDELRSKLE